MLHFTSSSSSCGAIFINAGSDLILCFTEKLKADNAFQAELIGAMRAIETAYQNGWNNMWLELDSAMVVQALNSNSHVPCRLRNRWKNCKIMLRSMNYFVSHVFREGNQRADGLANIGLSIDQFTIWNTIPPSLQAVYVRDA
ncbi:uncharacterized protein [Medicago truncatula]|uniref:uncharacterized protein n=1 Tax=Medicago truncatula TaxID=3880 RepID=UPI000D2F2294|nr:uncharacterized protein LOC112416570 [Medicago truncatula]